ncbi:putative metallopeptidase [Streptomyces ambofaciens ATCC 23877]|uniref:Aminopeptidase N n=1 Tax=Streptomyces ambofaciens (strain ATCC 23877 / 3486 / DSM 40053 / JCM 4204 / NBRC 12836 / NRRL B-2516) TaxID=278992 RepID=A0A0K2AU95_STRA7|nr:M1 family metallopeptidase [Streptomyces ambofaciens]AKZ56481.1 putative metallopeptidase [Streptomyces ambofaciens ATCC 23877]
MRTTRLLVAAATVTALAACSGGGSVEGTPGSSGVRDPYFPKAGNGGYDIGHYDLALAYDPDAGHLDGTATITARATQDLSAFNLDLKGLDVADVAVEGRAARFNRAGQELTVRPADELRDGETFRVTVRYSGEPVTVTDPDGSEEGWLTTEDGAVGLGQPTGSMAWFPGSHHPSDKAAYDLAVTVPEGFGVVSNGESTDERTRGGRTTFTWRTAEPMSSHVVTVAVGDWETGRSTTDDGLPVYTAVDPRQADASREVLGRIPEVMEWARENFGPYPFSSTGAIVDRVEDAGYALETQNRPYFPGAPDTVLLVHELAHQWYGNSVSPKSWRDMWLSEGFATYAEWLWEEDEGGDTAQETFDALYEGSYYPDEDANDSIWSFPPAGPPDAERISASPVYQRGAMVLHKIRETVGDDAFLDLLRGWSGAHRHGNADTADFTAYVEKSAPDEDFTQIWEDWLYGDGRPDSP